MVRQTGRQPDRYGQTTGWQPDRQTEWESDKECVSASLSTLMCTVQTSTHDSRWQLIPIVQIVGSKLSAGQDLGGQWCFAIVRTLNPLTFTHTVRYPDCIQTLCVVTWLALTCHHSDTSITSTVSILHLFFVVATITDPSCDEAFASICQHNSSSNNSTSISNTHTQNYSKVIWGHSFFLKLYVYNFSSFYRQTELLDKQDE